MRRHSRVAYGIEADWDDNINQRILVRYANFYHSLL